MAFYAYIARIGKDNAMRMKLDNAMTRSEIDDLNAKVKQSALALMNNAVFVGHVVDARTGEIIDVGANEKYDVYLLPNRSTYIADDYTNLI